MSGVNATYTDNIPFSSNNPSSDQPIMEQNTNSINSVLSVDHSAFNTSDSSGGYHSIIHQPTTLNATTRTWDPVTRAFTPAVSNISGLNQILSANYTPDASGATADTQFFNLTGGGGVSQLTGNHAAVQGFAWMGGLLVQWGLTTAVSTGTFASGTATGNVSFQNRDAGAGTIPFPNNCLVVLTCLQAGGNTGSGSASVTFFDKNSFSWAFSGKSSNFTGVYWIAIGQ